MIMILAAKHKTRCSWLDEEFLQEIEYFCNRDGTELLYN